MAMKLKLSVLFISCLTVFLFNSPFAEADRLLDEVKEYFQPLPGTPTGGCHRRL
jgi:hypothetical protein